MFKGSLRIRPRHEARFGLELVDRTGRTLSLADGFEPKDSLPTSQRPCGILWPDFARE